MCACACVCVRVRERARARKLGFHTYIHSKVAHSLTYFNDFFRILCTFTVAKPWDPKLTYNNDAGHTVSSKPQILHTLTVAQLVQNFLVKKSVAFSKTPRKSKAIYTWHFIIISNSAVLLPSSRTLSYGTARRPLLRHLLQRATHS